VDTQPADEVASPAAARRSRTVVHVSIAIAALVAAVVVLLIGGGDDDGGDHTTASATTDQDVVLASTTSPGNDPFTDSIATPPPPTVPQATVAATAVAGSGLTSVDGAHIGLYGGTPNSASCNVGQMTDFLAQNPDKARAWASAEGIDPAYVSTYLASLTSVVLRADTRVTNNGYANGVASPFQAVLEAGTAVLVDQYGVPRVRCSCGNPLSPPVSYETPTYTGTPWPSFQPTGIVEVQPAPTAIGVVTLVDVTTGRGFGRPSGTNGAGDTRAPPTPSTTAAPTTTPTAPAGGTAAPGSTDNYTLRLSAPKFSGTEGLMSAGACELVGQDLAQIPVNVATNGATIVITSSRFELRGRFDAATGSFDTSANVPPVVGDSKVFAMTGTISDSGVINGSYSITVAPPNATCTLQVTGARSE
jgi:hypothetical protein